MGKNKAYLVRIDRGGGTFVEYVLVNCDDLLDAADKAENHPPHGYGGEVISVTKTDRACVVASTLVPSLEEQNQQNNEG